MPKTDINMERLLINITAAQKDSLERLSKLTEKPISELIRSAITTYLLLWKESDEVDKTLD